MQYFSGSSITHVQYPDSAHQSKFGTLWTNALENLREFQTPMNPLAMAICNGQNDTKSVWEFHTSDHLLSWTSGATSNSLSFIHSKGISRGRNHANIECKSSESVIFCHLVQSLYYGHQWNVKIGLINEGILIEILHHSVKSWKSSNNQASSTLVLLARYSRIFGFCIAVSFCFCFSFVQL